ncbi:DUF2520 domain-containing protein [uncultured Microbacterium sp.]|uniref:DUF2520 domain-containing protein n=1 Tax=uncultured Microbacterium sp. TaxID=191216 RepID=UPI0025F31345|nr:DUF2520 domain-containing protein [uncultured Microbacterium sp.]
MNRAARLSFGVIGAGRVGPVIAAALVGADHRLVGITHGSDDDRVDALLPGVRFAEAEQIAAEAELIVLAVPHDQLAGLVAGLAAVGAWRPGQLVMHVDPGHGLDVLAPAAAAGAVGFAVHPAIAFTGSSMDLRQLTSAYAGVSAPGPFLPIALALAVELGCEPVVIGEDERAAYAEAVATASTFSREIVRQSVELLRDAGVENPGRFLSSLVRTSVDRALAEASTDPLDSFDPLAP